MIKIIQIFVLDFTGMASLAERNIGDETSGYAFRLVEKGYVDGDVWIDLSVFVSPETVASALKQSDPYLNTHITDVSVFRAN